MTVHVGGRGVGHLSRRQAPIAIPSLLTSLERQLIDAQGAWDTVKRPYLAGTTGNGLDPLFGVTDAKGTFGTDYGNTTATASLTDFSTHADWIAATKRILLRTTTTPTGNILLVSGMKTADGFIDINSLVTRDVTVQNCDIRNASTLVYGISQNTGHAGRLTVDYAYFYGQSVRNLNVFNGDFRRTRFDATGADNLGIRGSGTGSGAYSVNFEQCLVRRPAYSVIADPGAHGDALQATGFDNLNLYASTFYFPGTGTTYDEGVLGATNVLRLEGGAAATSQISKGARIISNLLIGGGYTVGFALVYDNQSIQNVLLLGNRYGAVGDYTIFGHIMFYTRQGTGGTFKNIAIFDEYVAGTTTPATISFNANTGAGALAYSSRTKASWEAIPGNPVAWRANEHKWGIFNFDKTALTAKDEEILRRFATVTGRRILLDDGSLNPAYDLGSIL